MQSNYNYFSVVINGRSIDEYLHDGKTFVEGREGSEYEIYFQNHSGTRKKIVISVDGLNILTGNRDWKRGYVVDGWDNITIPGWRKDSGSVAAFEFSSIKDSYNQHNKSGDKNNVGVIGLMVFEEKYVAPKVDIIHHYHYPLNPNPWWNGGYWIDNQWYNYRGAGIGSSYTINSVGQNSINSINSVNCSYTASVPLMETDRSATKSTSDEGIAVAAAASPLATGWGENKSFQTQNVSYEFNKKAQATMLIYYDSRKGLIKRGIKLNEFVPNKPDPQAFPGLYADGCPSPK